VHGDTDLKARRREMVERDLRGRGIRHEGVLAAMSTVPREAFLPPEMRHLAYEDRALPLSQGQTISQPYIVAAMTEALEPGPDDRVLEVGTGSGYQAAILAEIVARVYSVERLDDLADEARRALERLGYDNVRIRVGDGTRGWPEEAPFDGIVITAAAPEVPPSLQRQLSEDGGRLVAPVGSRTMQDLVRMVREGEEFRSEVLMGCRFVPLLGEEGW